MDLAAICEVLQATQNATDEALRKAAEQKLTDAKENAPDQLVQALGLVLAAGSNVAPELRQEAAVLIRQRVREDYDVITEPTRKALKTQLLVTLESDDNSNVRRNAGTVASGIAQTICEDSEESGLDTLMQGWPEFLPWIATFSATGQPGVRVIALTILKDLCRDIGEEMLKKGSQVGDMLAKALTDDAPAVRAAGAQLVLAFVQHFDDDVHTKMGDAMPMVTGVLQSLSGASTEKELEETLAALEAATEEEPVFFLENNFEPLWTTLMKICNAKGEFGNEKIRHVAMECIMQIAEGCNDEDGFKPVIESIAEVNFRWMLDVEKDVAVWVKDGKDTGEDGDIDDDTVRIGEENFDRLGEHIVEDDLMPVLFKVITDKIGQNMQTSEWTDVRAGIMAVSQVVEHLDEEARTDQCLDFIMRFFEHPHPRVRYTAFSAIAQCTYDQSERVHEKYAADLLPKIIKGMNDENVRVVTAAVEAFGALSEDMDGDDVGLADYMEDLLMVLFKHLGAGESTYLQEQCVDAIGGSADTMEEEFATYYEQVMPLLKQVIGAANGEKQRNLRGKAFCCTGIIGKAVGKEMFVKDACQVMDVMVPLFQAGFADDDKTRELAHEACAYIAEVCGKDFKGYVGALLPSVFAVLNQTPKDITELIDNDEDLDDIILNDLGALGLKTSVIEQMDDALELIITLSKHLEEEFCDFIGPCCQVLLPLLDYPVSEDVRETIYKAWGMLASLARTCADKGRLDPTILRDIVTEFLKKTVGYMGQGNSEDIHENNMTTCAKIHTLATGAADVIQKAGQGVLTREAMTDVSRVIGKILAEIECSSDAAATAADGKKKKKKERDPENIDEDDDEKEDEDDDDDTPTPQTVRFALADVMCALMHTNTAEFTADVLPTLMQQLVQKFLNGNDADRALGFYIADFVVDFMGETSVQYWQIFMNQALVAINDKSPVVQRYATKVIGSGAKMQKYSIMALASCQSVYQVLQKHGAKHKRRRVKVENSPIALAIDAAVRALGLICEHQQNTLGPHAPDIWSMWISSLPIKYDVEVGRQVHAQLLSLLVREHPIFVDQSKLPLVLKVLTDVYKTKLSTPELDKNIACAIAQIGPERLELLCIDFKENQKKKTQQMLKNAKAVGGA